MGRIGALSAAAAQSLFEKSGTGPHPHPATRVSILEWVRAGAGNGNTPAGVFPNGLSAQEALLDRPHMVVALQCEDLLHR